MDLIIVTSGSRVHCNRHLHNRILFPWFRNPAFTRIQVFTGNALGSDQIVKSIARAHGVEPRDFEAPWDRMGLAAGPWRNGVMLDTAIRERDTRRIMLATFAFPLTGPGTRNFIRQARERGLEPYIAR